MTHFITILIIITLLPHCIFAATASQYANLLVSNLGADNVQYAVMQNDKIISAGVSGTSVNIDTLYPIASISKMYTTAAIMLLIDQNQVQLDMPIIHYIENFKMQDPRYKDITVRMLLNHSSGLLGGSLSNSLFYDDALKFSKKDLLDRLATERLKSTPGEFSVYCNDGYALLEILIEDVSGMTFSSFLQRYFFEPLKITNTHFATDDAIANAVSAYHKLYLGTMTSDVAELYNYFGVGGILATAQDVCKFMNIYLNPGILSYQAIETTKYPEYLRGIWHSNSNSNFAFGLGWDNVNLDPFYDAGIQVFLKNGDLIGAHGTVIVIPQIDAIVCVLSTGSHALYTQMIATQIVNDLLVDAGIKINFSIDSPITSTLAYAPENLLKYSGVYANFYTDYTLAVSTDGTLTITSNQTELPAETLYYQGNGIFASKNMLYTAEFIEESNNQTYLETNTVFDIGLIPLWQAQYELVRLNPSITLPQYEQAWQNRLGNEYYLVDEYFSSILYTTHPSFQLPTTSSLEGFFGHYKIIDASNAINTVQIPQNNGRDISDLFIEVIDDIEYLHTNGSTYISENDIATMNNLRSYEVEIEKDNFSQWFFIEVDPNYPGIDISITGNGAFGLYNSFGECVYNSYLEFHEGTISLSGVEKIMFAGEPNTKFYINW
ncbi:serine hydrolase domain-containing protein [Candidatus Epulonipiscium viviparus]|uniref:serine hydrolase domain-containing protein n=1 Tax=Candidatus Epulonipiscium viviparus TaxID=420336 RepID=UPI002738043E|nr:serine hydrolase domain-containing protein [Candidatus Epulopiscium viviparus]